METKETFYDHNYIITKSESALDSYTDAYQKVIARFSNLVIIYSLLGIYLLPIARDVFINAEQNIYKVLFIVFSVLMILSVFFVIKLLIPVEINYRNNPKKYYSTLRQQYEQRTDINNDNIPKLLSASYITSLDKAIENNKIAFARKSSFYYKALILALVSILPFMCCLGYHFSIKHDNINKVEIVNPIEVSNFNKRSIMSGNDKKDTTSSTTTTETTNVPGVDNSQVINSNPVVIKESKAEPVKKNNSNSGG